jgi:glycosyltransferase involved in cell wall biosynthesis
MPNKGLVTVITALAALPGATLLVVGDGPQRAAAEAHAARLGIADRVTFAGWVPGPTDIADALRSAKVFVLNSLSEGGPRVLLEAMACGLPVATTRVGVAPETVTEGVNGTFHDGTAAGLAAALKPLLADDALRATMGVAGRAVAERYEYGKNIAAYAGYLRSLAR